MVELLSHEKKNYFFKKSFDKPSLLIFFVFLPSSGVKISQSAVFIDRTFVSCQSISN